MALQFKSSPLSGNWILSMTMIAENVKTHLVYTINAVDESLEIVSH